MLSSWIWDFYNVCVNIVYLNQMMRTLHDQFEGKVDALRNVSYHISIMDNWIDDIERNLREKGGQTEHLREVVEKLLTLNHGSRKHNNYSL